MKYVIAHFSYKVKSFILFCNLFALTFFKSFFFWWKDLSLPPETSRRFVGKMKAFFKKFLRFLKKLLDKKNGSEKN